MYWISWGCLNAILAKPIIAHRHVPSLYCYACAVFKAHKKKAVSIVCGCFTIGMEAIATSLFAEDPLLETCSLCLLKLPC